MYILVVGCGRIGFHLTKALLAVGHEVTALESETHRCKYVTHELGSVSMHGDGTTIETLKEAGAGRADLVIAVTDTDEANLAVCQLAKEAFNAARTMAVVKNPSHEALFHLLGVDTVINSTHLILSNVEEEVPARPLVHLLNLQRHSLDIITLSIPADADAVGKAMGQLILPPNSFVTLVVNDEGPHIPHDDLVLSAGDDVVVVTAPDEEQALFETLTGVK
jgi:trk system potassium uptake protein TrkA